MALLHSILLVIWLLSTTGTSFHDSVTPYQLPDLPDVTCTVSVTLQSGTVSCSGATALVSISPPPKGFDISVQGRNIEQDSTACKGDAVVTLCSSAKHTLVTSVVIQQVDLPNPEWPDTAGRSVLRVTAGGHLTFSKGSVSNVTGASGVFLTADNNIFLVESTFKHNAIKFLDQALMGGGVQIQAGTDTGVVVLQGNLFQNNSAGVGGGAHINISATEFPSGASFVMINNTFVDNAAYEKAGGVYAVMRNLRSPVATLQGTNVFRGQYGQWGQGGIGIILDDTTNALVTVNGDVTFEGNGNNRTRPGSAGGGLLVSARRAVGALVRLDGNIRFEYNAQEQGGALLVGLENANSSTCYLTGNISFVGNYADFGGGMYIDADNSTDTLTAIWGNILFHSNEATVQGGAIIWTSEFATNATLRILSNTTLHSNKGGSSGGGVHIRAAQSFQTQATVEEGVSFINNSALSGGAGYADFADSSLAYLLVNSSIWEDNWSSSVGGALAVFPSGSFDCIIVVRESTFVNNSVLGGSGGALFVQLGPLGSSASNRIVLTLANSTLSDNEVVSGMGGGLHIDGLSKYFYTEPDKISNILANEFPAYILNTTFQGNRASWGAGMFASSTWARVEGCRFFNNTASEVGGAVYARGVQKLEVNESSFTLNRAGMQGGAIATTMGNDFRSSRLEAWGCEISNNLAFTGGGLHLSGGDVAFHNCSMQGNQASQTGGAVVYDDVCGMVARRKMELDSSLAVPCNLSIADGSKVSGNKALVGGGVFVVTPGTPTVNVQQLAQVTRGNDAVYASDISLAPGQGTLRVDHRLDQKGPIASSTGLNGEIALNVSTDKQHTRVQIEFCNLEDGKDAFLIGTDGQTSISGEGGRFMAVMQGMRLMNGGKDRSYCLRIRTPDFPAVSARQLNVTIRGCIEGERYEDTTGCTTCEPGRYNFSRQAKECSNCPQNALCPGGAELIPFFGFWRSTNTSNLVQVCPNRKACGCNRDAIKLQEIPTGCQVKGVAKSWGNGLCFRGYQSRLCGKCASGYGSSAAFSCHRCAPAAVTAIYLLLMFVAACIVLMLVGISSVHKAHTSMPAGIQPACPENNLDLDIKQHATSTLSRSNNGTSTMPPTSAAPSTPGVPPTSTTPSLSTPQPIRTAPPSPPSNSSRRFGNDCLPAECNTIAKSISTPTSAAPAASLSPSTQTWAPSAPAQSAPTPSQSDPGIEIADTFKVLTMYMQYLGILKNLIIEWPRVMRAMMNLATVFVSPGSSQWVSVDCINKLPAAGSIFIRLLVPLVLVLATSLLAVLTLGTYYKYRAHKRGMGPQPAKASLLAGMCGNPGGQVATDDSLAVAASNHSNQGNYVGGKTHSNIPLVDVGVGTAAVALFVTFATLVTTSVSTFSCMRVGRGSKFWSMDVDVKCWGGEHFPVVFLGTVGVLVFCVGLPLGMFIGLRLNRARLDTDVQFKRRYGSLYRLYRPERHYWEACLCLQTVALVTVEQFARQVGTVYQLSMVLLVLIVVTTITYVKQPFRSHKLFCLYIGALLCLQVTCTLMLMLVRGYTLGDDDGVIGGTTREVVVSVMMVINCCFVVACLVLMGRSGVSTVRSSSVLQWVSQKVSRMRMSSRLSS